MYNKVSFYCYLFDQPADRILQYDILWNDPQKYILKQLILDANYKNRSEEVIVMVYNSLPASIRGIVGRLKNLEVKQGVYQKPDPLADLDNAYQSLVDPITSLILNKNIRTFSFFGQIKKYNPRTPANLFLRSMGYFILTTIPPHIYVLDDFLRKEYQPAAK